MCKNKTYYNLLNFLAMVHIILYDLKLFCLLKIEKKIDNESFLVKTFNIKIL